MLKAKCPNDPKHNRFVTVAHVSEDWVVDNNGDWKETLRSGEVVASPDKDNIWTCYECGAEATVEVE